MKRIVLMFYLLLILMPSVSFAGFGGFLREDTAVDVLIGPFVDDADGDTADIDATLVVELSKNGQALATKTDATDPVHDAAGTVDGYYNCELDATDTNTPGTLTLVVHHADDLPIRLDFQVVNTQVYDSLLGAAAADYLQVDVEQYDGQAVVDTVAGIPDVNVTYWEDDAVAAATDGHPAVNVEEWNDTDVPADVQAGYPTITIKDGTGTGEINTLSGAIVNVDLVDTTTTNTDVTAHAAVLGAAVGASISADIAAIEAQTDDIGVAGVGLTEAGGDGDHLTAINLPNQTMDIVGDITGNVSGSVGTCAAATVSAVGANVITAASIANAAIDNATLAADVGSTAYATNIIALAVRKAIDDYDPPTKTEMDTGHGLLATPAEVATELGTYDAPTKAEMDTAHALLATPAQVNAQVLDVIETDTHAELGQTAPLATTSYKLMWQWQYKLSRNKSMTDATTIEVYNDAGAVVDQKATISDDGTDFTKGEMGTGP